MLLFPSFWTSYLEENYTFLETIYSYENLTFGTQLNGGFASLDMGIKGLRSDNWQRYRRFLSSHVVLFDLYGRRIYEGRVQDCSVEPGELLIRADGHYSHGQEVYHGGIYPQMVGNPQTITETVMDCIQLTDGLSGSRVWAEKYAFVLGDADIDITALSDKDYTQTKIGDVIEEIMKYGYKETDARAIYFAIWQNRTPHMFVQPSLLQPTWFISEYNLEEGHSISRSRADIYNKIWGVFESESGSSLTDPPAEDKISIGLFGRKEATLNVGQTYEENAEDLANAALVQRAYPRQKYALPVSGFIRHFSGMIDYPYRIRAGDVVMMGDLDPYISHVGDVWSAAGSGVTGFVVATTYDANNNLARLEINSKDARLDTILARLGISGSLS
jgi:hypothetical protein